MKVFSEHPILLVRACYRIITEIQKLIAGLFSEEGEEELPVVREVRAMANLNEATLMRELLSLQQRERRLSGSYPAEESEQWVLTFHNFRIGHQVLEAIWAALHTAYCGLCAVVQWCPEETPELARRVMGGRFTPSEIYTREIIKMAPVLAEIARRATTDLKIIDQANRFTAETLVTLRRIEDEAGEASSIDLPGEVYRNWHLIRFTLADLQETIRGLMRAGQAELPAAKAQVEERLPPYQPLFEGAAGFFPLAQLLGETFMEFQEPDAANALFTFARMKKK